MTASFSYVSHPCSAYCDIFYWAYVFFILLIVKMQILKFLSAPLFFHVPLKCVFLGQCFSHLNLQNLFTDSDLDWVPANGAEMDFSLSFTEEHLATPLLRCEESRIGQREKMLQCSCKSDFSCATVYLEGSLVWRQGCQVLYTHPCTSKKELFREWCF